MSSSRCSSSSRLLEISRFFNLTDLMSSAFRLLAISYGWRAAGGSLREAIILLEGAEREVRVELLSSVSVSDGIKCLAGRSLGASDSSPSVDLLTSE